MNLIIDIGNTRIKAGLFDQNELKHFFIFEQDSVLKNVVHNPIIDLFYNYPIDNCIVASVVNDVSPLISALETIRPVVLFTSETEIPIKNLYKSSNTLGSDRLAAAIGGHFLFPHCNILVIDAGTCIKYNFVNKANEYIGGAISPGLKMRFTALHTFTARLPLLEPDLTFDSLIGTTTSESILSGVELGAIAEIQGCIEHYEAIYPDLKVILTGGDVNFFEKRLKKPIFTDSFLILKGLNAILEYNLNKSDNLYDRKKKQ